MKNLDDYGQPTLECLSAAWTKAIECDGIPGANSEALSELIKLRNLKTTWFGERENKFRLSIGYYIDYSLGGVNEIPT